MQLGIIEEDDLSVAGGSANVNWFRSPHFLAHWQGNNQSARFSPDFLDFMAGSSKPDRDAAFDTLEAQITELWGHVNAATFRFLALVAEFDRREGWARHGLANCAQWLNWQRGIGAVAAREKLRVAHALESLPPIGEAFRSGRVSYSKVRAITRVTSPESEADFLNVALHGTAMHVEKLVRQFRRVERVEEARLAAARHRTRFLRMYHDEDGMLVLNARLPAEVGAVVKKAIEAAMETICGEGESDSAIDRDHETAGDRLPLEACRADALRLLAEQFLSDEARRCPSSADRYQIVVHVATAALAQDVSRGAPCRTLGEWRRDQTLEPHYAMWISPSAAARGRAPSRVHGRRTLRVLSTRRAARPRGRQRDGMFPRKHCFGRRAACRACRSRPRHRRRASGRARMIGVRAQ